MKRKQKIVCLIVIAAMMSSISMPVMASGNNLSALQGKSEKIDGTWYYHSSNNQDYTFEKVSNPGHGADEADGLLDVDEVNNQQESRGQSYAWAAIDRGDYIYIGTCYNSTYGIYYRQVYQMMLEQYAKKVAEGEMTQAEASQKAAKTAGDLIRFAFGNRFPENLKVRGILVKLHKETGKFSLVYDSKQSNDPVISSTNNNGYRMVVDFKGSMYFVSLAAPTMFLLKVTPNEDGTDTCEVIFKRELTAEGQSKKIAAGVHGLIEYDNELIMCLADESSETSLLDLDKPYPEGGLIIASKNGTDWRVIATEEDLGPTGYHNYDGLFGGGIWDIIEYNGKLYVTVVTDLMNHETHNIDKVGFAMYQGTKNPDESFTWEMIVGDTDKAGVEYPYGLGTNYSMACNLWVYDNHLYMGTYNDPMCDLTEIPVHGNFAPLYWDLYHSISLYRMDSEGRIELVGGRGNDAFPDRVGNMGVGLGSHCNQYVWRMIEHDNKLWVGTYDTSTLSSMFTQLTDGQLVDMSNEEYQYRLEQLRNLAGSLGILEDDYEALFKVIGSKYMQGMFNSIQKLIDAGTGKKDPVPHYLEMVQSYNNFKDRLTNGKLTILPGYDKLLGELRDDFFEPMEDIIDEIGNVVYYFGCNYYLKNSVKGFDLLVTENGVDFDVVSDNGFDDPSNHGVRIMVSASTIKEGVKDLYIGTANPFNGAQLWKLNTEKPQPIIPGGGDGTGPKGSGGGTVIIPDYDVPIGLNSEDHFAYIQGYPDNTVRPLGLITREEAAAVFFRILDPKYREQISNTGKGFSDITKDNWSHTYITTLANDGIISGYPDGSFRPKAFVSRAELAVIVTKFAGVERTGEKRFNDVQGHWAEKHILNAANIGWVQGYGDGTFKPNSYITRAEFVTVMNSVLGRKVSKGNILPDAKQFTDLDEGKWYYEAMQEAINSHEYERIENNLERWIKITDSEAEI